MSTLGDGKEIVTIDSERESVREGHRRRSAMRLESLATFCRLQGLHLLNCATDDDLVQILRNGLGRERR